MRLTHVLLVSFWVSWASASVRDNKFRLWFPAYESFWSRLAREQCATEISDFHERRRRPDGGSACADALDCILENTAESGKSNLANAQVVLGLTPTILSFVGSDITELAALSSHHPLLAIILSLGAPALHVRQLFAPLEVGKIINKKPSRFIRAHHEWLGNRSQAVQILFHLGLYLLAAGAIANSVTTSLDLDSRSVVGFRCGAVYMPLTWCLLGVFPVMTAMIAVRQQYGLPMLVLRQGGEDERVERSRALKESSSEAPWISEFLFTIAMLMAVLQLVYGTSVLSAMTPISFFDALPVITRYAISNLVCRLLLLVELDRVRINLHG